MAEQTKPINSLVERLIRLFKKNEGLSGLWFKQVGIIHVLNEDTQDIESISYEQHDIESFFDAYDLAIERQVLTRYLKNSKSYIEAFRIQDGSSAV